MKCVTQDASNCFTENVKSFTGITNNNFQLTISRKTLCDYKASRVIITTNLHLKTEIRINISQSCNSELNTVFSRSIQLCDVTSYCCRKFHKVPNSTQNVLQSHYFYHFKCSKLLRTTFGHNSNQTSQVWVIAVYAGYMLDMWNFQVSDKVWKSAEYRFKVQFLWLGYNETL